MSLLGPDVCFDFRVAVSERGYRFNGIALELELRTNVDFSVNLTKLTHEGLAVQTRTIEITDNFEDALVIRAEAKLHSLTVLREDAINLSLIALVPMFFMVVSMPRPIRDAACSRISILTLRITLLQFLQQLITFFLLKKK